MNTQTPIYLSYTDADGVLPFFQLLDSKADFDLVEGGAKFFKRQFTSVKVRSPKPGDPPIDVACVSDHKISREEAERINQAAINFLMDAGKLEKR